MKFNETNEYKVGWMNTLLEGSSRMSYYTNLSWVFRAIDERQREFNWLLTDLQCVGLPSELPYDATYPQKNRLWLSGNELTEVVDVNYIQFIWGVLSGFRPYIALDLKHLEPYPIAEGNNQLWQPNARIQHPLAEVEIVCWDSSATILLSHDDDLTFRFRGFFPEAVDLDDYNLATKQI